MTAPGCVCHTCNPIEVTGERLAGRGWMAMRAEVSWWHRTDTLLRGGGHSERDGEASRMSAKTFP